MTQWKKIISVFFTWASVPLHSNSNRRWRRLWDHSFMIKKKWVFLICTLLALAQSPTAGTGRDMATRDKPLCTGPAHRGTQPRHPWEEAFALVSRRALPTTIASPFTSYPAFSWRLWETEISPSLLQQWTTWPFGLHVCFPLHIALVCTAALISVRGMDQHHIFHMQP